MVPVNLEMISLGRSNFCSLAFYVATRNYVSSEKYEYIAANCSRHWVYLFVTHIIHSARFLPLSQMEPFTHVRLSSLSSATRLARGRLCILRRPSDLGTDRVDNQVGEDDLDKLPRVDGANHALGLEVRLLHDKVHNSSRSADCDGLRNPLLPRDLRADGDLDGRHGSGVEADLAHGLHVDALGQLVQEVLGRLAVRVNVLG